MKLFGLRLLVASSWLLAMTASGATRPQYGGTLHIALHIAPSSLDPADKTQPDSIARRNLIGLVFDTLVVVDDFGRVQPALAVSWQAEPGNQRWRFRLRPEVKFDDGTPLTTGLAAASLRTAHPAWNVFEAEDSVVIELGSANTALPAELAQARYAIVKHSAGRLSGTGPFHVADWQTGKVLTLTANEEYWGGRPFLNSIQVDLGRSYRDQLVDLDLRKGDIVELAPEQVRRAAMEGRRVSQSAPIELIGVLFSRDRQSAEDGKLRDALALSIDRTSIKNVLLQGEGEAAGGILPNWMTGYGFLFPTQADMRKAQQERAEVSQAPVWNIGYEASDAVSRLIAERIALNAKDAGLRLQTTTSGNVDLRVVRVPLSSIDARVALANVAAALNLAQPKMAGDSEEALYQAESALLQGQRLIPLFHLPVNYGLSPAVKSWQERRGGTWDVGDVWLAPEKP